MFSVQISPEKFVNATLFLWLGLPSILIRHENVGFLKRFSNRRNLITLSLRVENDDVTIITWFPGPRFPHTNPIGHVRYINIQAWLRGFRVKIANFSSFLCSSIPKRDLDTKKTTSNIEVWPESLGAMLEYWYIERGLLTVECSGVNFLRRSVNGALWMDHWISSYVGGN